MRWGLNALKQIIIKFLFMLERLAYLLKHRLPRLSRGVEWAARMATVLRFGKAIDTAQENAKLIGTVKGQPAEMRVLRTVDTPLLQAFVEKLPSDWFEHFRPHPFDHQGLKAVLKSKAFMNYGLVIDQKLAGYVLLKVAPTGTGFIGLLVHPDYRGLGLGKFLVAFLYWQASLAGLRVRSTISRHNPASLRSHQAVADFRIVADLPNDYIMIEFPCDAREKPELRTS